MDRRPDVQGALSAFSKLIGIIADLRDPVTGCPWDLKQNHDTLRRYMIEEAYEAAEAMAAGDPGKLAEELGDVLLQVVLNAQIAFDSGAFTLTDVIDSISQKMLRRHPHVFGTSAEKKERELSQISDRWAEIKKVENGNSEKNGSVFGESKIEKSHPATRQACEIGKVAKTINFDWANPDEVFEKLLSEVSELQEAWKNSGGKAVGAVIEEVGDVYFTLAQFCRHLNHDPEVVAWDGNRKFLARFAKVEDLAANKGISVRKCDQQTLDRLWIEAKTLEISHN
jgi:MazG family protein